MNTIYINGRFLTQKLTGVQRFAYELVLHLSRLRSDVIILVPNILSIQKEYPTKGLNIHELTGGKGHYWEQITLPLFMMRKKSRLLVNLCNTGPAFYKNQIVALHDISYVRYPSSFSRKFCIFYSSLTPFLLRNSKAVITVSNFSKNEIIKYYNHGKDNVFVISNAVSERFYEGITSKNDDSEYFLTVSSINHHKNIKRLIQAILKSGLKIHLKIIGGTTQVFRNVNIDINDPRISFLGHVNDDELAKLYKGAKAFIFPSLYEGFGIPPLEAQSCLCPVISSNRSAMKEVLHDSVLYFDPECNYQIIKAISLLNNDKELRFMLTAKGRCNVRRFSWVSSAQKLSSLIDKVSFER
ncbi:glycosyltransferase family 4 protein [Enterobacter sp. JUb54]|uniref:glycosyltransferase family 4 protein n=1 Tax=Enterobacteriaceae TaxID=543 RepID=UPI00164E02FB|nr:glycosyltransferase family 1 protein [Enterobacter sp. JUb54]QNK08299.1 glycosyltransferase family 4 protein [Enterobacter sp. JUb54]